MLYRIDAQQVTIDLGMGQVQALGTGCPQGWMPGSPGLRGCPDGMRPQTQGACYRCVKQMTASR